MRTTALATKFYVRAVIETLSTVVSVAGSALTTSGNWLALELGEWSRD